MWTFIYISIWFICNFNSDEIIWKICGNVWSISVTEVFNDSDLYTIPSWKNPLEVNGKMFLQMSSQASAFHGTSVWSDRLPFWFKLIKNNLYFASRPDVLHMGMREEQQFISSQGVTCIFNNSSGICWDVSCYALIKSQAVSCWAINFQWKYLDFSTHLSWM